jgi:hypothetical protein
LSDVQLRREVPGWSVVEDALLHLKAVRICVECVVIVNIWSEELDDDLLANFLNWDAAKLDNPLRESLLLVKSHNDSGSLILLVLIVESDLRHES